MDSTRRDHLETARDVAAQLKVKPQRVYEAVRDGCSRAVRIGRRLRFRPEDVRAFLRRNETQARWSGR